MGINNKKPIKVIRSKKKGKTINNKKSSSKKTLTVKKSIKEKKTIKTKKANLEKLKPKKIKKTVYKKKVLKKESLPKLKAKKKIKKALLKKTQLKRKVISKKAVTQKKKGIKLSIKKGAIKPILKKSSIYVKQKLKDNSTEKSNLKSIGIHKTVKAGVKTKKQIYIAQPQPIIEVSSFPKTKVKTLLISQPKPESEKNPYYDLSRKYNLNETFRQFIKIEGFTVKEFRDQRINILEHKAVILTSRLAVDHYFRICNEMRVTVPETMKYFCINEATAYYLQKYIQYRKRKIFFGHQTIRDLVDVIKKNKEERFLLPASDVHKEQICDFLDALNIKYTKAIMYSTVSADLSDIQNLNEYDMLVFFTPAGIKSLKQNFPKFNQGATRIACFGPVTAKALKKYGYRLDIYAPNERNSSMSGELEDYLKESNRR
jgi:uroporphyrinogen-III synthase